MKQKQTQNVKIIIGEVAKKRKAPARRARRVAPNAGGPPGGGAPGGPHIPLPRPPPVAGAPGYFPIPQMFASRAGPAVEPVSQLQQLLRPIEQSLLRLLPPQASAPSVSAQDIREFVARFTQPLFERLEQPVNLQPLYSSASSSSSSSTLPFYQEIGEASSQTDISMPDHTAQYQLVGPDAPLVRAVEPPLVDAVVQPDEKDEEILIEEEEEELPMLRDYTIEDIQKMNQERRLTPQFLQGFQVSKITPSSRGMNLLKIGRALGISFPKEYKGATKQIVINYITERLANPKL